MDLSTITENIAPEFQAVLGVKFAGDLGEHDAHGNPVDLQAAVCHLYSSDRETWDEMARDLWDLSPRSAGLLSVAAVVQAVRETNESTKGFVSGRKFHDFTVVAGHPYCVRVFEDNWKS